MLTTHKLRIDPNCPTYNAYAAGLRDGVESGYKDGWERGFDAGVEDANDKECTWPACTCDEPCTERNSEND